MTALALSPDGKRLASGGEDRTVTIWDWASHKRLASTGRHCNRILSVAFSPDGTTLATAALSSGVGLWNTTTGRPVLTGQPSAGVPMCVALSPDRRTVAVGHSDGGIRLWELARSTIRVRTTLRGHEQMVGEVAWNRDGKRLASCSEDRTVRLWDATAGTELRLIRLGIYGEDIIFSIDGSQVVVGGYGQIHVYESTSGEELQTFSWEAGKVGWGYGLALSPDGKWLAHVAGNQVVVRDLSGTVIRTLAGPTGQLESIAFSPDGSQLAGAGIGRTVTIWEASSRSSTPHPPNRRHPWIASPLVPTAVGWRSPARAVSWRSGMLRPGPRAEKLSLGSSATPRIRLVFTPDSRHLLAANANGTVYVLRLASPGSADKGPQASLPK